MDEQNKPRPFSLQDQERLTEAVIEPMAGEGLRTIGIAYKKITIGKYSHTSYVCVCSDLWTLMLSLFVSFWEKKIRKNVVIRKF